jgi:hypothetical protein
MEFESVAAVGKPRYLALIPNISHSQFYFSKINIASIRKEQTFFHYTSGLGLGPIRRKTVGYLFRFTATGGHAVAQWLRHCATNLKIAGWIPDGVIEIFH